MDDKTFQVTIRLNFQSEAAKRVRLPITVETVELVPARRPPNC